jgi:hypothetical protein
MTTTPDEANSSQNGVRETTGETAGRRGTDDRREPVNPAQNPAPSSPEPDREALRRGEEILERVKPY